MLVSALVSYLLGILVTAVGLQFLHAGASKLRACSKVRDLRSPGAALALVVATAEILGGAGLVIGSPVGSAIVVILIMVTTAAALIRAAELDNPYVDPADAPEVTELSLPAVVRNFVQAFLAVIAVIYPVTTGSIVVLTCALAVFLLYLGVEAVRTRWLALHDEGAAPPAL
jgi:uncharacterized membrane protein YphA (DoxX/SURF4 family)